MQGRALIIGGSNGLGLEFVREAEERGIWSIAISRNIHTTHQLTNLEARLFTKTFFDRGDITRPYGLLEKLQPRLAGITYLFLVAGNFCRKPFGDMTIDEIDALYETHLVGPRKFLHAFHRLSKIARPLADDPGQPYHLVMIGSTSSWRMRENEAIYAEVQAAKAHFTRQFAVELARDLPGSKTTLVCPAGMATGFFEGTGVDTSNFMKPRVVAQLIWDQVLRQVSSFIEMHILRTDQGEPIVQFGQKMPEAPK